MKCPFELPVKLRYGDLVELLGYTPHAKYVVQAINSHDALLEACKDLINDHPAGLMQNKPNSLLHAIKVVAQAQK